MGFLDNHLDQRAAAHGSAMRQADDAWKLVREEIDRALRKFPAWPTDPCHASAIVVEEVGETAKAALQCIYEDGAESRVHDEAIQAACVAIRFVMSLERYDYTPADQHAQDGGSDER